MDGAAEIGVGEIVVSYAWTQNFVAAVVGAEGCPTAGYLMDTVAGTNQNLRSAKLVGHAKKIIGQMIAVISRPNARRNTDRRHVVSAINRFGKTFQARF